MTSSPPPPPDPEDGDAAQPTPYPAYSSYPAQPADLPKYPAGTTPSETAPEAPQSIRIAVNLMRVGAGLALVTLVTALLQLDNLKDTIRTQLRDKGTYSQSTFNNTYHVAIASTIVLGVLGIAVWLWMAQVNGKGRRWGRIVSTVLGGLNIFGLLVTISQGRETTLALVFAVLSVALAAGILALLWRAESTVYYHARSARRVG